jgi:hypothetical protein
VVQESEDIRARNLSSVAEEGSVNRSIDDRLARGEVLAEMLLEFASDLPFGDAVQVGATKELVDSALNVHVRWATRGFGRTGHWDWHVEVVGRRTRRCRLVERTGIAHRSKWRVAECAMGSVMSRLIFRKRRVR